MNRDVKFKVWNNTQKVWIDPSRVAVTGKGDILVFSNQENQGKDYWAYDSANGNRIYTISRETGFKDKKGQLIYEGDIVFWSNLHFAVEWHDSGKWSATCPYYVVYKRATTVEHFRHLSNGTVVGNIFETPELLKKS